MISLDSINNYQTWLDINNNTERTLRSPIYNNYFSTNKINNLVINSGYDNSRIARLDVDDSTDYQSIRNSYYFTFDNNKTIVINIIVNSNQILSFNFGGLYIDNKGNIKLSTIGSTLNKCDRKFLIDVNVAKQRSHLFVDDITSSIDKIALMSPRQLKRYKIARSKRR